MRTEARRRYVAVGAGVIVAGIGLYGLRQWVARPAPDAAGPTIDVRIREEMSTEQIRSLAMVGDRIELRASASHLWIFRGERLIAECPSSRCTGRPGGYEITLVAEAPGRHRILAVSGGLAGTERTFDRIVLDARTRDARLRLAIIDVVAP